jgi:hypothetical protein
MRSQVILALRVEIEPLAPHLGDSSEEALEPSRFRPLSAPGPFSRGSIASFALRPAPRSTYASLISSPPRAQGSIHGRAALPLPGRKLHPLEAPGSAGRTENFPDLGLKDPTGALRLPTAPSSLACAPFLGPHCGGGGGTSRLLGEPLHTCPGLWRRWVFTPGPAAGAPHARPWRDDAAFRSAHRVGPTTPDLSELHLAARMLAVDASRRRSPDGTYDSL